MGTPHVDAVVVGAGIAGLAAALELQSAGCEVLAIDPADRPGGVLRTNHWKGFVVESGPNTTLVKPAMRDFLDRRQLLGALRPAAPAARRRYLYRDGRLRRVPSSLAGLATTGLVPLRGKLRVLTEPLRRRGPGRGESVAEFVGRRLGDDVARGLVGPFLTGVYAGDEDQLGAAAVFPRLVELEERFGSIALGGLLTLAGRRGRRGLRGSHGGTHGFGPFARKLAEGLAEPPALGSRVTRVARDADLWRVDVTSPSGDTTLSAERVVVAAPAPAAAEVLRGVDAELANALEGIPYAPIVVAPVGLPAGRTRQPIEGFGFLVPREEKLGLLGCLFVSQFFDGRAPAGHELLHCMLGGVRWPDAVHQPDDVLIARLAEDLDRTLGLRDAPPPPLALIRWVRAVPQPGRDHAGRMAWIGSRLDALPGLALAGSYVAGVSVSDALASGITAAERALGPASLA